MLGISLSIPAPFGLSTGDMASAFAFTFNGEPFTFGGQPFTFGAPQ